MLKTQKIMDGLGGRKSLSESEVKTILSENGIAVPDFAVASSEGDLARVKARYPVAMKVCSPDILHKTDVGGVFLNVQNEAQLKANFTEIKKKFPKADVLIEPMESGKVEAIVGLLRDPTFGMTIMFGIGGVYTEVYKDVVFRVVPIEREDAEQMLGEIRAHKLLEGFRGIKTDREALIRLLLAVSDFAGKYAGWIDQMDLNPVFVKEKGVVVLDAKMILK